MSPSRQIVSHSTNIHFSNCRFTLKLSLPIHSFFPSRDLLLPWKNPSDLLRRDFSLSILKVMVACDSSKVCSLFSCTYQLHYPAAVHHWCRTCVRRHSRFPVAILSTINMRNFLAFLPSEKKPDVRVGWDALWRKFCGSHVGVMDFASWLDLSWHVSAGHIDYCDLQGAIIWPTAPQPGAPCTIRVAVFQSLRLLRTMWMICVVGGFALAAHKALFTLQSTWRWMRVQTAAIACCLPTQYIGTQHYDANGTFSPFRAWYHSGDLGWGKKPFVGVCYFLYSPDGLPFLLCTTCSFFFPVRRMHVCARARATSLGSFQLYHGGWRRG